MAQYKTGTITLTNGSATATGDSTEFLTNVSVNDFLIVDGESVIYQVNAVSSDTVLTLSGAYQGVTNSSLNYTIVRDFSNNLNMPLMGAGDTASAALYTNAINAIDSQLNSLDNKYVNVTGDTLTGSLTFNKGSEIFRFIDPTAGVDFKNTVMSSGGTLFSIFFVNDANTAATIPFSISRNGFAVDGLWLRGPTTITDNLTVSNSNPSFNLTDTDSTVDNKNVRFRNNSDTLVFELTNDAVTTNTAFFRVDRTGNTADALTLTANTIKHTGVVTGNTAPTAGDHLTRKDYVDTFFPAAGGTMEGNLTISSTNPAFHLNDTDSTVNNRRVRFRNNSDTFLLELTNDAVTTNTAFFRVDRTGNTADALTLTANTIKHTGVVTGNTAPTAADHLTRKDYVDSVSDRRAKKNIKPVKSALKTINKLNICQFDFNKKAPRAGHSCGVLADELEKVLPKFVHEQIVEPEFDENDKQVNKVEPLKYVDYTALFSVAIQSIQELSVEIETLKAKINDK